MTPAFSIIIPAYNAAPTLEATLRSVDAQTDQDFEVVVVDDGSTDGTGDLAERLCAGRGWQVVRQANAGLPAARNAGLRAARGRWMALLDSDDLYLPGFLARMRELLSGGAVLAFADAWIWHEATGRFARRAASRPYRPDPLPADPRAFFLALKETNFVYGAACAPLDLVRSLGGFNEQLRAAEDWEMWLRLSATGGRAAGTNERLAIYRHRAGQMSKDLDRMFAGQLAALRSVRERCELNPEVVAALDERIARAERLAGDPRHGRSPLRALAGRAIAPVRPVRDYRLRVPAEVRAVLSASGAA
jgi:glycosyltransferase involved in cell wall biosynthesis